MNSKGILVPTRNFNVWVGGRLRTFRRGRTTVRDGHPILDSGELRRDWFRPLTVDYDVEDRPATLAATANGRAAPVPAALAERAALVSRARELGIPAKGKSDELAAAVAAAEGDEPDD
jgi:hypothetical protein